jgi:hypothetical protein
MSIGKLVIAAAGIILVGAVAREHAYRRQAERQYRDVAQARRELELRVGEILASHQRLQQDLTQSQQRSQELSETLASTRVELERTVARLTEESQNARSIHTRFSSMQHQMDQLQGELAVTLEQRHAEATAKGAGAIQLERVIVSDAAASDVRGRVVSIHPDWGFVVINLGWDAVRIGDTVSIFHEDQLLAKARVDRVQEGICAATILPAYRADDIHVNDLARIL